MSAILDAPLSIWLKAALVGAFLVSIPLGAGPALADAPKPPPLPPLPPHNDTPPPYPPGGQGIPEYGTFVKIPIKTGETADSLPNSASDADRDHELGPADLVRKGVGRLKAQDGQ